jgi:hypothetical protein
VIETQAVGAFQVDAITVSAMSLPVDVCALDDATLHRLASAIAAEQHARALAAGDLNAVVADAFAWGFTARGAATPRIVGAYLVCPGLLHGWPENHDCTFVSVDDAWCWDHELVLADEVARDDKGQRSVTVLAAVDGVACTQVASRARRGSHTARQQQSWRIEGGALVPATVGRSPRAPERR